MAESKTKNEEPTEEKKPSSAGFFIGFALVTFVAVGTGWFLGGAFFASSGKSMEPKQQEVVEAEPSKEKKAEQDGDGEEAEGQEIKASRTVTRLEPIIVSLRNSNNSFLRLELAVITEDADIMYSEEGKLRLIDAISTFSKTISMRNISGPSGYLHFREDVLDVARLSTNGEVKDLLILSMVAE